MHYVFYLIAITSTTLLIALLPGISYIPVIPFGILLIYTVVIRPYQRL